MAKVASSFILSKAGLKTGLYTSPYIHKFNEQIQVNNSPVPDEDSIAATEQVRVEADKMVNQPAEFELITVVGFVYFTQ